MSPRKVIVTGATGFVGSAVVERLLAVNDVRVLAGTRNIRGAWPAGVESLSLPDLENCGEIPALPGVDALVHCAARVHVMNDHSADPLAEFRRCNVDGTLNLARQAAASGVRRFIFISSIKVNGESTIIGQPFHPEQEPTPEDAYGISKLEAELGLMSLAQDTGMEVVIIRPPLVYGPGVKGNFARMMSLISKGLPLPLGAIHNKRSLVGIDNLVDLIVRCIDHPAAANQVFLAGDGEDLSTTELLRGVAEAMGRPAHLLPVPARLLSLTAALLGKRAVAQRLLDSLQVDISKAHDLLGWIPPVPVKEGLKRCIRDSSI